MTMQCEIDDFEVWETCEACAATGTIDKSHPFPDDPYFTDDRLCDACGGSGRILKAWGERNGGSAWKIVGEDALSVVNEQAEDECLWFVAETPGEDMLQRALRRLHAAVECGQVQR